MLGLHKSITLSFLTVGHTKFSPDWCFGLLKQKFRKSKVDCLDDIARVVDTSADVNFAQLVGTQSEEVIVPTYNWSSFFKDCLKEIPQLKKQHHFYFSSETKGKVSVKEAHNDPYTELELIRDPNWKPSSEHLPPKIIPEGLSNDRQWYLYNIIREFCSEETKDIVCPCPDPNHVPTPSPPSSRISTPTATPTPAATRQQGSKKCSKCGQAGHNKRSCKNY